MNGYLRPILSRIPLHLSVRYSSPSIFLSRLPNSLSPVLDGAQIDVSNLINDIKETLNPTPKPFKKLVQYQFTSSGKLLRPLLVTLISACTNTHASSSGSLSQEDPLGSLYQWRQLAPVVSASQHRIAMITEMIHTASLIHDDLLDSADLRRGRETTYRTFGHKEAILGGDFILTHSSRLLAEIGNTDVIAVLSAVISDLIHGELMQLTTHTDDSQRFQSYLDKTYRKTASLIANSCKAAAMLTHPKLSSDLIDCVYEFGRHLGMAFQLIDDVLDFVGDGDNIGKPVGGADLLSGIATGPVLFAAQSFPELNAILLRQFSLEGDREKVLELVDKSDGVGQTRMLAEFHFQAAQRHLLRFRDTPYRQALLHVAANCLQRTK